MKSRLQFLFAMMFLLTCASLSAAQSLNPSDAVENVGQGMINWTSGEVYATGIGAPPPNAVNLSTSVPRATAVWYASSCSGTVYTAGAWK